MKHFALHRLIRRAFFSPQSRRALRSSRTLRTNTAKGWLSAAAVAGGIGGSVALVSAVTASNDSKKRLHKKKDILSDVVSLSLEEKLVERLTPSLMSEWTRMSHYLGKSYPLHLARYLRRVSDLPATPSTTANTSPSSSGTPHSYGSSAKSDFYRCSKHERGRVARMRYAMRHAALVYGGLSCTYMTLLSTASVLRAALENMQSVSVADILTGMVFPHISRSKYELLLDRTTASSHEQESMDELVDLDGDGFADGLPKYYVCVDRKERAIVVCVRGTMSLNDVITDLNYSPHAIEDPASGQQGYTHKGMWRSARHIARESRAVVKEALHRYPDYRLVITGHSLGAGTAALLAFIWGRSQGADALCKNAAGRIDCFAFASPCILSKNLAETCHSYITSVAYGTDCVTRLGLASAQRLLDRADAVAQHNTQYGELVAQSHELCDFDYAAMLKEKCADPLTNVRGKGDLDAYLKKLHHDFVEYYFARVARIDFRDKRAQPPLYPCGSVWWFLPAVCLDPALSVFEVRQALLSGAHLSKQSFFIHGRLTDGITQLWNSYSSFASLFGNSGVDAEKSDDAGEDVQMEYVLCEATALRPMFSELVFDAADSFVTHLPSAYARAMGINFLDEFDESDES